jgi:hypothetical protein
VSRFHQRLFGENPCAVDAGLGHGAFFHVLLGIEAGEHPAAQGPDGTGRQHAFRSAARAHHDVHHMIRVHGHERTGHVAVGVELDARTGPADGGDEVGMARLVQDENDQIVHILAESPGNALEVVFHGRVQVGHVPGLGGHHDLRM